MSEIRFDVSLDDLAGGAIAEKLHIELRRLASNVADPNTEATAARSVTLTIAVKPDKARQVGSAEVNVKSTLAPSKGIPVTFLFDFESDGTAVIREHRTRADVNQTQFTNSGDVVDGAGEPVNKKVVAFR